MRRRRRQLDGSLEGDRFDWLPGERVDDDLRKPCSQVFKSCRKSAANRSPGASDRSELKDEIKREPKFVTH